MTEKAAIVDLETGGTRPGDAIFSIGAVVVDLDTGEVGDFFYKVIDVDSAQKHGLLTVDTMLWWGKQTADAKAAVFDRKNPDRLDMFNAIQDLGDWFKNSEADTIWGNGATFDVSLVEHFFLKFEIPIPWQFWKVRDIRTLVHLVGREFRDKFEFTGIEHHALHDAAHEAKYTSAMWQIAKKGLENELDDFKVG